jgi:hypothetical protein
MFRQTLKTILPLAAAAVTAWACAEEPGSVPEVPAEELLPEVAELDAVHEVMAPMWHEAFPGRDFPAIQASVSEFEPLLSELDAATLPGILQDKQVEWDEGKIRLMEAFQGFKAAAEEGDEDGMLAAAEAFHGSYEGMVRIIRPVVPELDAFHRYLYGVYHYYGPGYDLEKIQEQADQMAAALPPLQDAQLPSSLEDRQAEFEGLVAELGGQVAILLMTLEDPTREDVDAAIESVHAAYKAVEAIFD